MNKTTIEWTDFSWNPVTGCTPISPGCAHCYAKSIAMRFAGTKAFHNGFDVTLHPERLEQPLHWRKPRRVFLCSAGDLFHEAVPDECIDRIFAVMACCQQHRFLVLTKRPEGMAAWYSQTPSGATREQLVYEAMRARCPSATWPGWPLPNVWLGVSAENQEMADERIPLLLEVPAAVRFVSVEPMLGPVWMGRWLPVYSAAPPFIDWVIVGGESGTKARPMHPDWVRSFRDQCQAAGVPFWFKQWGEWAPDCLCGNPVVCKSIPRPMPGKPGVMFRCGKRAAGHLLDGQEWRQFPG